MNQEIINAIKNKQLIRLDYEPGVRIIEPHTYGRNRNGNELLRAYQTDGASASGEQENWKLFRIDRIESLEVLSETFDGPRDGYTNGDSAMTSEIYAEL